MSAAYPPVEESLSRLHRAGWSVGDVGEGHPIRVPSSADAIGRG